MSPFVGLWSRLDDFHAAQLATALHRRTVVRGTLMRGTLHLVTAGDYLRLLPAVLPMIRRLWRSYLRERDQVADDDELTRRALAYAADPRTNAEMREHLGGEDAWWRARRRAAFVHAPISERWAFGRRSRLVSAEAWPTPTARV